MSKGGPTVNGRTWRVGLKRTVDQGKEQYTSHRGNLISYHGNELHSRVPMPERRGIRVLEDGVK